MAKYTLFVLLIFTLASCKPAEKASFDKIVFHTGICFGDCPVYHLEVDQNKNIHLYAETVYKNKRGEEYLKDASKIGYFIGKVNDATFNKLSSDIKTIGLDTLTFDNSTCCDASLITIIVYYNGKRKYLQSMFPPNKAHKLINTLLNICTDKSLKRADTIFSIESPKEPVEKITFPPPVKN